MSLARYTGTISGHLLEGKRWYETEVVKAESMDEALEALNEKKRFYAGGDCEIVSIIRETQ